MRPKRVLFQKKWRAHEAPAPDAKAVSSATVNPQHLRPLTVQGWGNAVSPLASFEPGNGKVGGTVSFKLRSPLQGRIGQAGDLT